MRIWQEYAVEPALFSDIARSRYFLSGIGLAQGRLIAAYPRKWLKAVRREMMDVPDIDKHELIERLISLECAIVPRDHAFDGEHDWCEQAVQCDKREPFHGIVSAQPFTHAKCINGDFAKHPLWKTQSRYAIPRRADALAAELSILLKRCTKVVLIDREFNPTGGTNKKWWNPIRSMARVAAHADRPIAFEIHSLDKARDPWPAGKFAEETRRNIPGLLPKDFPLRARLWRQRSGGVQFHERLIVTDIGGVSIDPGIDEGKPGEEYHLRRIDDDEVARCLRDYADGASTYELVDHLDEHGTA